LVPDKAALAPELPTVTVTVPDSGTVPGELPQIRIPVCTTISVQLELPAICPPGVQVPPDCTVYCLELLPEKATDIVPAPPAFVTVKVRTDVSES
jgi:hypothetical protein